MRTRVRFLLWIGPLILLAVSSPATAGPVGESIALAVEFIVNPVEGSPGEGCHPPAGEGLRADYWAIFSQAEYDPEGGSAAGVGPIECGRGASGPSALDLQPAADAPYLVVEVSATAGFLPSRLTPRKVLLVDISLTLRKLSGLEPGDEPADQRSSLKRRFYLLEDRETLVPLLVATDAERERLGTREVFLRLTADPVRDDAVARFGVVAVIARGGAGDVLLDGSIVDEMPEGGEILLHNVPVGLREVGLRDPSGHERGDVIRVEADRTVVVELGPADNSRDPNPYRLEPLGTNTHGYEEFRRARDGAVVVAIPAGEFLMGNRETERTPLEHWVYVSDFLMDKTGVTWGQYKRFAAATGTPLPPQEPYWGIHDDHPVVFVTWEEGKAYCEWAGGRLPTEAEREKAARGLDDRKYPWGNEEPDPERGVFRHEWGYEATEAVGTHPAGVSPYGLHDMGGNVWEWCSDWYSDAYYAESPERDPQGPPSGSAHVVRGGSWDSRPDVLSSSCRNWGYRGYREGDFGFRCAMSAPGAGDRP